MGVANELRDFEQITGDPGGVRRAANSLREAASHLPVPSEAAGRLQEVAGGVTWQGDAYAAYRAALGTLPMPAHLDRAVTVMDEAAGWLDWYAERLADDQEAIEACRQRWLALGLPDGGEVPADLEGVIQEIDDEAAAVKQAHRSAQEQLADAFEGLTAQTAFAKPPPGILDRALDALGTIGEFAANFAYGVVEGVWEMVKGLAVLAYYLNPVMLPYTAQKVWENRDQIVAIARYAWENPGDFALTLGKAIIDWETLTENPARWLGKLVPDLILAFLTAGSSRVATTAARTAKGITGTVRAARAADRTRDVGAGLSRTQRILQRGRNLGERMPANLQALARGDTGGLTRGLYDFEVATYKWAILEQRIPVLNTSAGAAFRNVVTGGWNGRLMTIDRWVNGMPNMSLAQRAYYVSTHAVSFANMNQNVMAAADRYFENLVNATDGKPPERFDFNWDGDGFEVNTPWAR